MFNQAPPSQPNLQETAFIESITSVISAISPHREGDAINTEIVPMFMLKEFLKRELGLKDTPREFFLDKCPQTGRAVFQLIGYLINYAKASHCLPATPQQIYDDLEKLLDADVDKINIVQVNTNLGEEIKVLIQQPNIKIVWESLKNQLNTMQLLYEIQHLITEFNNNSHNLQIHIEKLIGTLFILAIDPLCLPMLQSMYIKNLEFRRFLIEDAIPLIIKIKKSIEEIVHSPIPSFPLLNGNGSGEIQQQQIGVWEDQIMRMILSDKYLNFIKYVRRSLKQEIAKKFHEQYLNIQQKSIPDKNRGKPIKALLLLLQQTALLGGRILENDEFNSEDLRQGNGFAKIHQTIVQIPLLIRELGKRLRKMIENHVVTGENPGNLLTRWKEIVDIAECLDKRANVDKTSDFDILDVPSIRQAQPKPRPVSLPIPLLSHTEIRSEAEVNQHPHSAEPISKTAVCPSSHRTINLFEEARKKLALTTISNPVPVQIDINHQASSVKQKLKNFSLSPVAGQFDLCEKAHEITAEKKSSSYAAAKIEKIATTISHQSSEALSPVRDSQVNFNARLQIWKQRDRSAYSSLETQQRNVTIVPAHSK